MGYPPETNSSPLRIESIGKGDSYWKPRFLGAIPMDPITLSDDDWGV